MAVIAALSMLFIREVYVRLSRLSSEGRLSKFRKAKSRYLWFCKKRKRKIEAFNKYLAAGWESRKIKVVAKVDEIYWKVLKSSYFLKYM